MGHHLFSKLKSVDALYSLFSELSVHTNMDGVIVFGRWIGKYYYIRFMECGTKRGFVQRFVLPGVFKFFNITFNDVVLEDTTPHIDITDGGGHFSNGVLPHVGTQRSVNKWRYFLKAYENELNQTFPKTLDNSELFLCGMSAIRRTFQCTLVPVGMQLGGQDSVSSVAVPSSGGLSLALGRLKALNALPLKPFDGTLKGSTLPLKSKVIANAKQAFINFISNVFVFDCGVGAHNHWRTKDRFLEKLCNGQYASAGLGEWCMSEGNILGSIAQCHKKAKTTTAAGTVEGAITDLKPDFDKSRHPLVDAGVAGVAGVSRVAGVAGDDLLASTEIIESMMAHDDMDDDDAEDDGMTAVQHLPSNCLHDPTMVAYELLKHPTTVVRKFVADKALVAVFPVRLGCVLNSYGSVAVASCTKTEEVTTFRCTCEDKWKRDVNLSVSQHLVVDVTRDSLDQSSKGGCCHMLACQTVLRHG